MLGGLHPALGFVSAGFTGFLRSCPFGVVPFGVWVRSEVALGARAWLVALVAPLFFPGLLTFEPNVSSRRSFVKEGL